MEIIDAYNVGREYMSDNAASSRFSLAVFLHGHNPDFDFWTLADITREIGFATGKKAEWF